MPKFVIKLFKVEMVIFNIKNKLFIANRVKNNNEINNDYQIKLQKIVVIAYYKEKKLKKIN